MLGTERVAPTTSIFTITHDNKPPQSDINVVCGDSGRVRVRAKVYHYVQ